MKRQLRTLIILALAACHAAATPQTAVAGGRPRKKRLIVTFQEGLSRAQREKAANEMGLKLVDDFDKVEVSVLEAAGDIQAQEVRQAENHPKSVAVEEDEFRKWIFDDLAQGVELAVQDQAAQVRAASRRRRRRPDSSIPWGVARVNAPAAWPSSQGAGVKVAVIDTGVDCAHPDLKCDFSAGTNLVDRGEIPMDDNKHGTHVAGTIAGRGAGGPFGVAPKATLIPVKVLDAGGSGNLSDIVAGINWAIGADVHVINMSLGGPGQSAALRRAVKKALSAGVVVVCAAGNTGPEPDTVGYPAGYPGVIAVAASDEKDRVASFSSRGPAVAFVAPGVKIVSTVPGGGVKALSGTSMAAPHVSGLAALVIKPKEKKDAARVRGAFKSAATKLRGESAAEQGAGMIDASRL